MKTIELIFNQDNYYIREAFNSLRTNILFSGKDVKSVLITSCLAHEGKTTVSVELARSLAQIGKRVLFVDGDLRNSVMVARYTKERNVCGLSQVLSGQIDAAEAIYRTQYEGFDILFAGPQPPNPTELLGSETFKEFLISKRDEYDYIIVDAAPVGLVIDAAVMAPACDGAVLVIGVGRTKHRIAQSVKEQLRKTGVRMLGVVLNQIDKKASSAVGLHYEFYGSEYHKNSSKKSDSKKKTAKEQK